MEDNSNSSSGVITSSSDLLQQVLAGCAATLLSAAAAVVSNLQDGLTAAEVDQLTHKQLVGRLIRAASEAAAVNEQQVHQAGESEQPWCRMLLACWHCNLPTCIKQKQQCSKSNDGLLLRLRHQQQMHCDDRLLSDCSQVWMSESKVQQTITVHLLMSCAE